METNYERVIAMVADYIRTAMAEHPIKDGNKVQPHIYYMNGNDGTEFDWDCNGRTCEFFVFYDTKDNLGYIKAYVTHRGTIEGYVWDTERPSDGVMLSPKPLHRNEDKACEMAEDFKENLYELWDCSNTWDSPLLPL